MTQQMKKKDTGVRVFLKKARIGLRSMRARFHHTRAKLDLINRLEMVELFIKNGNIKRCSTISHDQSVIIHVSGGLADQLFFYTLGVFLEITYSVNVKFDLTHYGKESRRSAFAKANRNFQLIDISSDLKFDIADKKEINFYKTFYYTNVEGESILDLLARYNNVMATHPVKEMGLVYRDPAVIAEIKRRFPLDEQILPRIRNSDNYKYYVDITRTESVAVHVRRGDMLSHAVQNGIAIPHADYYIDSIHQIKNRLKERKSDQIHVFLFSNDMQWVKNEIVPHLNESITYTLVEGNDESQGIFDFYLISKAKHQIISLGNFARLAHLFFNDYDEKILITPQSSRVQ